MRVTKKKRVAWLRVDLGKKKKNMSASGANSALYTLLGDRSLSRHIGGFLSTADQAAARQSLFTRSVSQVGPIRNLNRVDQKRAEQRILSTQDVKSHQPVVGSHDFLQMHPRLRHQVQKLNVDPARLPEYITDMHSVKELEITNKFGQELQLNSLFTRQEAPRTTRVQASIFSLAGISPTSAIQLVDTLESLTIYSSVSKAGGAEDMWARALPELARKQTGTARTQLEKEHTKERQDLLKKLTYDSKTVETRLDYLYREEQILTDDFVLQSVLERVLTRAPQDQRESVEDMRGPAHAARERMRRQVFEEVVSLRQRYLYHMHEPNLTPARIRSLQDERETETGALPLTLKKFDEWREKWWAVHLNQMPNLSSGWSDEERQAFRTGLQKLWNLSQLHQWQLEELRRAGKVAVEHKEFMALTLFIRPVLDLRPFTKLQTLRMDSPNFNGPILGLPSSLTTLELLGAYNQPLSPRLALGLPNLEELRFGHHYNKPFPSEFFRPLTKLRVLDLGRKFNHELPDLPLSLRELVVGSKFDRGLDMSFFRRHTAMEKLKFLGGTGPKIPAGAFEGYDSLTSLFISRYTGQFREGSTAGLVNLTHLKFAHSGNQPLPVGFFQPLTKLETFHISGAFNQPIDYLPSTLQELSINCYRFNRTLPDLTQLTRLKTLELGFNQPVPPLPPHLEILRFGFSFNQRLPKLPNSLRVLVADRGFNNGVALGNDHPQTDHDEKMFELPASIEELSFGPDFNRPLPPGFFAQASRLRELDFGSKFSHPLPGQVRFPPSLQSLKFSNAFNFADMESKNFLEDTRIKSLELPPSFKDCTLFGPNRFVLPQSLEKLVFEEYNSPLPSDFSARYPNIRDLSFRLGYNRPLQAGQFINVRYLNLGCFFAQPLVQGVFSPDTAHLALGNATQILGDVSAANLGLFLPKTLKTLSIDTGLENELNRRVGSNWYQHLGLKIQTRYTSETVLVKNTNTKKRKRRGADAQ